MHLFKISALWCFNIKTKKRLRIIYHEEHIKEIVHTKEPKKFLIFSGVKSYFLTTLLQRVEKSNKLLKTAANYVCVVVKTNAMFRLAVDTVTMDVKLRRKANL